MEPAPKGIIIKKSTMIFKNSRVFAEEYEIQKKLGQGSYGTVYNCLHKETGTERAAKSIKKE
jgi:serine/threonine protein kinase